jgi:hypothetical protein
LLDDLTGYGRRYLSEPQRGIEDDWQNFEERNLWVYKASDHVNNSLPDLAGGRNIVYVQNIILTCAPQCSTNNVGKRRDNRNCDVLDFPNLAIVVGDRVGVSSIVRLVNGVAKSFIGP